MRRTIAILGLILAGMYGCGSGDDSKSGSDGGVSDSRTTDAPNATSDTGARGDVAVASDAASADTSPTADAGADTGAGPCGTTITLAGAPAFMGTSFTHNDPVNPTPQVVEGGGNTTVNFMQRDINPANTKTLMVTWKTADPTSLKTVSLGTGAAGYSSFDSVACGLGCTASEVGMTIDATGHCIRFANTVVSRYNASNGQYDTPVTLNGSIGY